MNLYMTIVEKGTIQFETINIVCVFMILNVFVSKMSISESGLQ